MKKYLAELHTKPDHHKKRFALIVSAGFTMIIFGIWSLTTFGVEDEAALADANQPSKPEVSPFQSLIGGVGASFQAIFKNFGELKEGLEVVNFEATSQDTLNNYGQ